MASIKKDIGHEETDALLESMEKRISKEYKQAEEEMQEKLDKYMSSFVKKDAVKYKQYQDGKISHKEYLQWEVNQMAVGKRWKEMRNTLAQDLTTADQKAKSIAYGYMPEVYAINHNYGAYLVDKTLFDNQKFGVDTSFTLYDRQTVEHLFNDQNEFYHAPGVKISEQINSGKTLAWNKKQVQSCMIQSILQGESIPNIAKRLATTVGEKNKNASIRNARTMTTGVENAGRVDSYKQAAAMGIDMEQEWLATLDGRTRHEHRMLDGKRVPVGKPFKVEGYEIRYPGDPAAEGCMVYNCRCTLIAALKGFSESPSDMSIRNTNKFGYKSYDDWKKEHEADKSNSKIVNVKDVLKYQDISNIKNNNELLDFANKVIKETGVDVKANNIKVEMRDMEACGGCRVDQSTTDYDKICRYNRLSLDKDDDRPMEYRVKTVYHESYHLSLFGKEWDAIQGGITKPSYNRKWTELEETFTECYAHYKMQTNHGITGMAPAYPEFISLHLPRLKQLPEFSECKTLQDFGKIANKTRITNYDGKNGKWTDIYDRMNKIKIDSSYYERYYKLIEGNEEKFISDIITAGQIPKSMKDEAEKELKNAISIYKKRGELPQTGTNEAYTFFSSVALIISRRGLI